MNRLDLFPRHRELVFLDPQHLGDVGAVHVEVEKADFLAMVRECIGKVDRDGRFADAALAAQDHDDVPDIYLCLGGQGREPRPLPMNRYWRSGSWSTLSCTLRRPHYPGSSCLCHDEPRGNRIYWYQWFVKDNKDGRSVHPHRGPLLS